MNIKKSSKCFLVSLTLVLILLISCRNRKNSQNKYYYGDAHTHLTSYGESALDSLVKYNVTLVRDCGGDVNMLKKWKNEIEHGVRIGPQIFFSGPMIDGRKDQEDPNMRIAVYTPDQARHAVDSLKDLGVDFIKTHSSISPECYFAVLKEAKVQNLKVVSHMSNQIPVWLAADSGLSCIEHAAESFLAAPIGAGFIKSSGDTAISDAIAWWRSPRGDSIINHLGNLKIYFTPTLFGYKVWSCQGRTREEIDSRLKVFDFLKEITFKLHKAGVIILAGTDMYDTTWQHETPGLSLFQEITILEESGLTKEESVMSATIYLQAWIETK